MNRRYLCLFAGALLWAGSAQARTKTPTPTWTPFGILSLSYRAIGQKPIEVEIENQVYLSDIFVGLSGPVTDGAPFILEFRTDPEGSPQLYRFTIKAQRWDSVELEAGRFLIPYGRFNELYRPDQYVSITRPLLYASPASLDFVSRAGFPHPIVASGYVDTGLKVTVFPPERYAGMRMPNEVSAYVVNGLGESPELGREPPRPRSLSIPRSSSGVDMDFGHERNFLSDNNDNKVIGLRLLYEFGDFRLPLPGPEGKAEINGFSLGFSGLTGAYDLEDTLQYYFLSMDTAFQMGEFQISAEAGYSPSQYQVVATTETFVESTSELDTSQLLKDRQVTSGYYVQTIFPFWEMPFAKRTNGFFRFDQLFRHGADLRAVNVGDSSAFVTFTDLTEGRAHVNHHINKYSFGFTNLMTQHFQLKLEFSYWDLHKESDIYQGIWSAVLSY